MDSQYFQNKSFVFRFENEYDLFINDGFTFQNKCKSTLIL